MDTRLDVKADNPLAAKVMKHLIGVHTAVHGSLPTTTLELINIRTSQINGCGFCLDMHTKDAVRAGESHERLHLVATWRESNVFTEAERAALDVAEQGARLADGGEVSDDAWANAAKHFDEEQLTGLVAQIAAINAFNIVNVITRQVGGDYQPGQFG